MKDGNEISAKILEVNPLIIKYKKCNYSDGPLFTLNKSDIFMLKYKDGSKEVINNKTSSRYSIIAELGFQPPVSTYGLGRIKVDLISGYNFSNNFFIGLGLGMRFYTYYGALCIPIYSELRYKFNPKNQSKISPYLSTGIGYTIYANYSNFGNGMGLIFDPTIGISINLNDKNLLNLGLGFELQREGLYSISNSGYTTYLNNVTNGAVTFDIGYIF